MKNYYLAMKRSYKSILIGILGGYLATLIKMSGKRAVVSSRV